jgi:hypothetical protein
MWEGALMCVLSAEAVIRVGITCGDKEEQINNGKDSKQYGGSYWTIHSSRITTTASEDVDDMSTISTTKIGKVNIMYSKT